MGSGLSGNAAAAGGIVWGERRRRRSHERDSGRFPRGGRSALIFSARRKGNTMFCNSCNNGLWIIILIIILFGCGNNGFGCGCGCDNNNNGCGCGCN